MKLLINMTCVYNDRATGIERFALHLSRELSFLDASVAIVASEQMQWKAELVVSPSIRWSKVLLKKWEYLFRALWDQTALRRYIARCKPDVVLFPIQDGMLCPPVKQIITVHDLHYLHFKDTVAECRQEIPAFRRLFYRVKMPYILRRSAAIVAVSEATKLDIVKTFGISPEKVHVVYNGYDSGRFHCYVDPMPVLKRRGIEREKYFLFVGSILRHKNIVRLIQAFARQDTSMSLVIAGSCKDPGYLEEVMNTSAGLGSGRVRYLEYVSDDDLPSLYSGAVAFVLPSLHEGFGVPIIEAMACGTPVITSNCSAMPEVAGDAALLVDPYSVESIAYAMCELLSNPLLVKKLKVAGFERAQHFRWTNSARRLYELAKIVSES